MTFVVSFSLEFGAASLQLFLSLHRMQAARVQLQQVSGVLLCFGSGDCPLEARARRAPAAVAGGHGNKFHHVERNVFIAPRPYIKTGNLFHRSPRSLINFYKKLLTADD